MNLKCLTWFNKKHPVNPCPATGPSAHVLSIIYTVNRNLNITFMKYLFLSLTAICLSLGCVNAQNDNDPESHQDLPGNNNGKAPQYTGRFYSKRGVMDPVSCHGFNIGYLRTPDENLVICFDRLPGGGDLNVLCEKGVWVTGYFEEHTANPNGSCPGSVRKIFYVTEWRCQ